MTNTTDITATKAQIQSEIDLSEDNNSEALARASEYLADDSHKWSIGSLNAEDAADWLVNRAEQDIALEDHCREQLGC